jgi:hypothetical protein
VGQPSDAMDGTSCDRFGVEVHQERANVVKGGSIDLDVHAVARLIRGIGDVEAPLILLEPRGCEILTLNGSGNLTVSLATGEPGYINLDSDGTTCAAGSALVLDVDGGTATVRSGAITMWVLAGDNAAKAFDPANTDLFNFDNPRISPTPIPSFAPVGRLPMDWKFNCKEANDCPYAGTRPAYIDELVNTHKPVSPNPNPPAASTLLQHGAYQRWSNSYSCNPAVDITVPDGDWYIDCPTGLSTNKTLTFQGGNILAEQAITVTGTGKLRINCAAADGSMGCPTSKPRDPSIYYIRNGNLARNFSISMYETFVYLEKGGMSLGGSNPLYWTAPEDPLFPFDDLLVWTETTTDISLRGSSDMTLAGVLFAPNARITAAGDTGSGALNAQIWANRMDIAGGSNLHLQPRENRSIPVGRGETVLIR